jgi:hypothetical protein
MVQEIEMALLQSGAFFSGAFEFLTNLVVEFVGFGHCLNHLVSHEVELQFPLSVVGRDGYLREQPAEFAQFARQNA